MEDVVARGRGTRLGDLERAVLDVLWSQPPARLPVSARDVLDAVADRGLAYMTVKTVLDRLTAKGLVTRTADPTGRALVYRPAATREAYVAELMLEALSLSSGDRDAALLHFAQAIPHPDADVLRDALGSAPADGDRADPGAGERR